MPVSIRIHMDPQGICRRLGLGPGGSARRFLAERVRARCDKYVPYDTGALKNTAQTAADGSRITYVQPYAVYQFYKSYRHPDPRRGDHWEKRMLSREREALIREVAAHMTGGGL